MFFSFIFVSVLQQTAKKIADAKLAKDFQSVLKEFQKAQRIAAERETAYAPYVPKQLLSTRWINMIISSYSMRTSPQVLHMPIALFFNHSFIIIKLSANISLH